MSDHHTRIVSTREEAHEAAMQAYTVARALIQDGKRVRISAEEDSEPITIKQRRFLHGPLLGQISEQVRVGGERYVMDIWKEYFRKEFLGDRFEMRRKPIWDKKLCCLVQSKRATPHRVRNSTEDLSIKQYSDYIDRIISHATVEWSVNFHFLAGEREAVRWVRAVAKQKQEVETV